MNDIIQIKCPFDGAVLSVKYAPGIESKTVTCPVCRHKYPFSQFKRVAPKGAKGASGGRHVAFSGTDAPTDFGETPTQFQYDDATEVKGGPGTKPGSLTLLETGVRFQLHDGRNVIGRKAQNCTADFQIDTGDGRLMSREHLVIDVEQVPGKGLVHCASLYKEQVNETFIGQNRLFYGDCVVLSPGDLLRLPDAILQFSIE